MPRGLHDAGLQQRAEAEADAVRRAGRVPAGHSRRSAAPPAGPPTARLRRPRAARRRTAGGLRGRPPPRGAASARRADPPPARRECPWDREQDERSIVPHTVEEAYELAAAAHAGDDAKLLDELGDVLFQVHFLSLLLEERGAGSLAEVAEHCRQKLVRRHPHVFGDVEAEHRRRGAAQLGRDQGDRGRPRARDLRRGAREPARARCTRARCSAARPRPASTSTTSPTTPSRASSRSCARPRATARSAFHEVGDVLFAAVNVARKLQGRPGARAARRRRPLPRARRGRRGARRRRRRATGHDLTPERQLGYYSQAAAAPNTPTETT